jgi:hypothetical protein
MSYYSLPSLIPVLGSTSYVVLPDKLTKSDLNETIHTLDDIRLSSRASHSRDLFNKPNLKIRILYDNPEYELIIFKELAKYDTIKYNLYSTNYFSLTKSDITSFKNSVNISDIQIIPVLDPESVEYTVLENFLSTSHGVTVRSVDGITEFVSDEKEVEIRSRQLSQVILTMTNELYLVKYHGKWVGCFDLVKVNHQEYQLHGVSGMSTLADTYLGKKLPILTAAMISILQNTSEPFKILTMSNNNDKVSELYRQCGFLPMIGRQCILVTNQ